MIKWTMIVVIEENRVEASLGLPMRLVMFGLRCAKQHQHLCNSRLLESPKVSRIV